MVGSGYDRCMSLCSSPFLRVHSLRPYFTTSVRLEGIVLSGGRRERASDVRVNRGMTLGVLSNRKITGLRFDIGRV